MEAACGHQALAGLHVPCAPSAGGILVAVATLRALAQVSERAVEAAKAGLPALAVPLLEAGQPVVVAAIEPCQVVAPGAVLAL